MFRQLCPFLCSFFLGTGLAQQATFQESGVTSYGSWSAQVSVGPAKLEVGALLTIQSNLSISSQHLALLQQRGLKLDGFVLLTTLERTFDPSGWLRLAGAERMSMLLTPTGLPIEGGIFGAVTNRFGSLYRSPIDLLATTRFEQTSENAGLRTATFQFNAHVPNDMPPGIYRIRFDYGFTAGQQFYSLNAEDFAQRSVKPVASHHYSPPLRVNGKDIAGHDVDMSTVVPRIPWVLLADYNSNGYRGVVADEDRERFNISGRNLIQDDVILPLVDDHEQPLSYSLEPRFLADTIESQNNIPWNFASGFLSVQVVDPNGALTDLGTVAFTGRNGIGPTTGNTKFTSWRPPAYGLYKVRATGWIEDVWGNRYSGGGTYRFWIAKRMTMSTATFQGMAFPVGSRYGRDIGFAPAVPADVEITARLFVNSDPNVVRMVSCRGKASSSGVFGPAQGMKQLLLDAPGEYFAHVVARYKDKDGHLWVSTMRHAGVVYPEPSPIVAHGKKLFIDEKFVDRGETKAEGGGLTAVPVQSYASYPYVSGMFLNYPYLSGDVLLIASDQEASNVISPVLTAEWTTKSEAYDPRLKKLEATNLRMHTSNGLSPHLFPEFIDEWAYYYSGAPRPGLMARFLVGEDGVRTPYWPTSPNDFGGQINASTNGDVPGDIYRLIGGTVIRTTNGTSAYAGYLASGFILPKGSRNNRIVSAGSEDLIGPDGSKARFWLTGTRPGQLYEAGASFVPAIQIDPILPADITFTLHCPDGRTLVAKGTGNRFGTFVGTEHWTLDVPGLYRYKVDARWQGHQGRMPGLPPDGGHLYVIEKNNPADNSGLHLDLSSESTFDAEKSVPIVGTTSAKSVWYAAVIPGAIVDQGELAVRDGKFTYVLDPAALHKKFQTYDTIHLAAFTPELKDVVHLTFFSQETGPGGSKYHSFVRLIIRGNRILYTK